VTVVYDPSNPGAAYLEDSGPPLLPMVLLMFGGITLVLGIAFLAVGRSPLQ